MPGLDTSIPLQAQAPQTNPLQLALQAQQYKYLSANTNQLQQAMGANQAYGQAIQNNTNADGTVDMKGVQRDVASNPDAAYNLQAATGQNLAQQGQQISNGNAGLQLQTAQQSHLTQQLGTLINKPDLSRDDVVNMATQSAKLYGLPDNVVQQSIANIPADPAQLKPYLYSKLAALGSPDAQATAMTPGGGTIDTGPTTGIINMRPAAGAIGAPVATYTKGLTPEGMTTPTQIGVTPAGAPITGTRQQFVDQSNKGGGVVTGLSPYQQGSQQAAAQYESGLNSRVTAANNSQHYLSEAQDLLKGIQTGGGQQTRAALAARAQAIPLMPQSVVDAINGGNLGDTQTVQKILVQNAVQQMQTSFNGTGGQANVDLFLKNNPNLANDPRALPKLMQFASGMNAITGKEQQAYRQYVNGGGNPADFGAKWATSTPMRAFTGAITPVKTGTYNGRPVVQYSDGSVDYQ